VLSDLLGLLTPLEISNAKYYNLEYFTVILNNFPDEKIEVRDTIILPFYIDEKRYVFELYDYELNIRLVDTPNVDNYLLTITGKSNISEIDIAIEKKLRSLYWEIIKPNKCLPIYKLRKYVDMIQNSEEIIERVERHPSLDNFSKKNLYFEIY